MKFLTASLFVLSSFCYAAPPDTPSPVKVETLLQSAASWDGTPYKTYPSGQPQITVLKYTIAAHTTMKWHTHPFPNSGYILSGELTIEKKDGTKKHFVAGEALTETVDSVHRGITGDQPLVLVVFYAGTPGKAVTIPTNDESH
ncbi:cupin domain-containing protein [Granulicella sp. dw_53]|uniref:cupin domain-containing protein n=1 Tax=Granulicella sp. dw_53 TaxID=2719792 RepID=UPI001BD5D3C1|nr:cupin domain-containing protein [Granulicella sp. dw_53]